MAQLTPSNTIPNPNIESNQTDTRRPSLKERLSLVFRPKNNSSTASNGKTKLSKRRKSSGSSELPLSKTNSRSTTTPTTNLSNQPPRLPALTFNNTSKPHTLTKDPPQRKLQHGAIYHPTSAPTDEQTGETLTRHPNYDATDLLHGLGHRDSSSSLESLAKPSSEPDLRPPGDPLVAKLPSDIWTMISSYLSPCTSANLAIASRTLLLRLGDRPFTQLNQPQNRQEKIDFLLPLDDKLPGHLFCFPCVKFHRRLNPGQERLRANTAQLTNPVYVCPLIHKPGYKNHRLRLTPSHTLPFTLLQLVSRSSRFGAEFGIPLSAVEKRWKDTSSEWSHTTRFMLNPRSKHIIMRVISKSFAAPNLPLSLQRHLLYSREDYTPYFSVCSHWRDGDLMDICKCALSHIPERRESISAQLAKGPKVVLPPANQGPIVSLCSFCRSLRRCERCPTEYLVELKLSEDTKDSRTFKQTIMVTRWSDLGMGVSPEVVGEGGGEWAAVVGNWEGFESLSQGKGGIGKRAISGWWEGQVGGLGGVGGRMVSLNPTGRRRGEDGEGWY